MKGLALGIFAVLLSLFFTLKTALETIEDRDSFRPGLLDVSFQKEFVRKPAADDEPNNVCFAERISEKNIKGEIENTVRRTHLIPTEYKSSPLKILEYFKKRAGDAIAWNTPGVSSCQDVPCVYQKIYGGDSRAKDLAYLFFISTGTVLSATTGSPGVSASGKLSEWLWEIDELEFFAYYGLILPTEFTILPSQNFKRFYRMQHGMVLANQPQTCGQADPRGSILLMDNCLETRGLGHLHDFIFIATHHELNHEYDFDKASTYQEFGISTAKPWIEYSGWRKSDSFNNRFRVAESGWSYDTQKEGFPRSYGGTAPWEDWADATAYARFNPDELKAVAPQKYQFIKDTELFGRDYSSAGLKEMYDKAISQTLYNSLKTSFAKCSSVKSGDSKPEVLLPAGDLTAPGLKCLEEAFYAQSNVALNRLRFSEPEGCDILGGINDTRYVNYFLHNHSDEINDALKVQANDAVLGRIRQTIGANFDPKQVYLSVYGRRDQAKAYQEELKKIFKANKKLYEGVDGYVEDIEWKFFSNKYTFETARDEVQSWIKGFTESHEKSFIEELAHITQTCVSSPYDGPAETEPFRPQSELIQSRLVNCINHSAKPIVKKVISESLDQLAAEFKYSLGPQDDVLRNALQSEWTTWTSRNFDEQLEALAKSDEIFISSWYDKNKSLLAAAFRNENFMNGPLKGVQSRCLNFSRQKIRGALEKEKLPQGSNIKVLDYSKTLVTGESEMCQDVVLKSPSYISAMEEARNEVARSLFARMSSADPKDFPATGGFKDFVVVGLDKEACLTTARPLALSNSNWTQNYTDKTLMSAAEEVCTIGRYAGHLAFRRTSGIVFFGGKKVLGTATYIGGEPQGEERPYYLYSVQRYLIIRTAEILSINGQPTK